MTTIARTRTVPISRSALARIAAHAKAAAPFECCGALLGRDGTVTVAKGVQNESRRAETEYWIGPEMLRRLADEATDRGLDIVGFYHSHTASEAIPSDRDLELAWPSYVYLVHGSDGVRAWVLRSDRSAFDEVPLRPLGGEAT